MTFSLVTGDEPIFEPINLGTTANDGTGDSPRAVGTALNAAFADVESRFAQAHLKHINSFGAVGDGTTDDTAAFQLFNTWAIEQAGIVELHLAQDAIYKIRDNTFVFNIRNLKIHGHGSTLRNSNTDSFDYGFITCSGLALRGAMGEIPNRVGAYFFDDADAGATAITFTTAAELSNFTVGDWVMLGSHGAYPDGYPPAFRKFDFLQITAISGTQLTFHRALRYDYRANDIYVAATAYSGKAACYRLEQASLWPMYHEYNDLTFETTAQASKTADYVTGSGKYVRYNRCTAYAFNPSMAEHVVYDHCTSLANNEFDKLVCLVEDFGSRWKTVGNGITVETAKFYDSSVEEFALFSPRNIYLENTHVAGAFIIGTQVTVDTLEIKGGSIASQEFFPMGLAQQSYVTIGASSVTLSGSILSVPCNHTTVSGFLNRLRPGLVLHVSTSSGGGYWVRSPKQARVVSFSSNGTTATINLALNFTPAGNETLVVDPEPIETRIENCLIKGKRTTRDFAVIGSTKVLDWSPTIADPNPELNLVGPTYTRSFGYPKRIRVDVKKAYSGSIGTNVVLTVRQEVSGYTTMVAIDLKTTGVREITRAGSTGLSGTAGESSPFALTRTAADFVSLVALSAYYNFATAGDAITAMPIVDIEIDYD